MANRKRDDDYRTFQQEWTEEFAFVERAGFAVCAHDKISSMKRSNIKRHFDTRHATFAAKYPAGDTRKKACQELLSRVQAIQHQLRVWVKQGDYNSASFAGSLAIVRSGKPFTDGKYAKSFMLDVANELFDDFNDKDKIIKRIKDMPFSARTVHDRTIMMSNQVEKQQVNGINAAKYFSLALDESTDVSHISQFSIIARYVAGDMLREESLVVLPLKGTTRGEDLLHSLMEFANEKNLPMDKLVSLVIRVVNFVVARALNDRQFKALLDEVGNNYPGLILHSNVRWLSRGKVLSRFAACLSEIRTFHQMKGFKHPELTDTEWLLKFYYLVDMTEHLNQLNVKIKALEYSLIPSTSSLCI